MKNFNMAALGKLGLFTLLILVYTVKVQCSIIPTDLDCSKEDCQLHECPSDSERESASIFDIDNLDIASLAELEDRVSVYEIKRRRRSSMVAGGEAALKICCLKKCQCRKCEPLNCKKGEMMKKIAEGDGKPGTCCPQYQCVPAVDCASEQASSSTFWLNECSFCSCQNGFRLCKNMCLQKECAKCIANYEIKEDKEVWWEDRCTEATCDCGEIRRVMSFNCNPNSDDSFQPVVKENPSIATTTAAPDQHQTLSDKTTDKPDNHSDSTTSATSSSAAMEGPTSEAPFNITDASIGGSSEATTEANLNEEQTTASYLPYENLTSEGSTSEIVSSTFTSLLDSSTSPSSQAATEPSPTSSSSTEYPSESTATSEGLAEVSITESFYWLYNATTTPLAIASSTSGPETTSPSALSSTDSPTSSTLSSDSNDTSNIFKVFLAAVFIIVVIIFCTYIRKFLPKVRDIRTAYRDKIERRSLLALSPILRTNPNNNANSNASQNASNNENNNDSNIVSNRNNNANMNTSLAP